ncbi:MAG: hypothetical protein GX772_11645, partial [Alcaligenaceae bacterium]|nr:hypothetical protein [Alcaligenaceae bacterium]
RQVDAARNSVGNAALLDAGLQLTLPLVAEDGSSVPLTISSKPLNGTRIKRLELFAPGNPTPEVAVFEFGPEIQTLNLATRIRLSESQTVIAVAHTEDGQALVAERPVRVTVSGCIAPAAPDPDSEMKARVRVPDAWAVGAPVEVLTMISHPMVTGLAEDAAGNTPAVRIIERFEATLNGQPLISARYFRSLAANPYLKFDLTPQQAGELALQWVEDTGRKVEHNAAIRLA